VESVGVEGYTSWHEADFYDRADAIFEQTVIDLIDIGEVVDGVAVLVFVVRRLPRRAGSRGSERSGSPLFLHGAEVVAVALTQRKDGAAGAEHLFPEVGEWCGLGVGVDLMTSCAAAGRRV